MHISRNKRLRSAWRQCRSGSANTAQSFFPDRRPLLSSQIAGSAGFAAIAVARAASVEVAIAMAEIESAREGVEASFRLEAEPPVAVASEESHVAAHPERSRSFAPADKPARSRPQPALSAPQSLPGSHPVDDLRGCPCAYTNSLLMLCKDLD